MITDVLNADREPILPIFVHDTNGQEQQYSAVLDTGYTGWLTLPSDIIAALGLTWRERGGATLADGSQVLFDVYNATVFWDSRPVSVPVDEVDSDPLVEYR